MGDYDVPLVDLGLVPSAVMTFAWHPEVAEEVSQQGSRRMGQIIQHEYQAWKSPCEG